MWDGLACPERHPCGPLATGRLSVSLHRLQTNPDGYPGTFDEGAETPAALSGRAQRGSWPPLLYDHIWPRGYPLIVASPPHPRSGGNRGLLDK